MTLIVLIVKISFKIWLLFYLIFPLICQRYESSWSFVRREAETKTISLFWIREFSWLEAKVNYKVKQ